MRDQDGAALSAANGEPERYRLITFDGAFHGRTLATIAAGGQAKHLRGLRPAGRWLRPCPAGDIDEVGPRSARRRPAC